MKLLNFKPGANKQESYAKALDIKPSSSSTANQPSCVRANSNTHQAHSRCGTHSTCVFFKKHFGNGEGQVTSRIIHNSSA